MVTVDLALRRTFCAILIAASLVACTRDEPVTSTTISASSEPTHAIPEAAGTAAVPPPDAVRVEFDVGDIKSAAEYLDDPELGGADLERGRLLSLACAACHTFGAGEKAIVGPNLHGVFGRHAASLPDFAYSPALRASDLYWTPRSLAAWLADPGGFVSGTTMTFTGYRSAADRRDLIAYLLRATSN